MAGSARRWRNLGIKIAYTPLGILVALIFIGLPFVGAHGAAGAERLGRRCWRKPPPRWARRGCRPFRRVVLPALAPALLTGAALAFARAVGEYGSVIFIAGNLPMVSRDRAAADRHQAGGVRLCRRRRDRRGDAGASRS